MCGIVGYQGHRDAREVLIGGLKRLEYRGYDSAGLALAAQPDLLLERQVGKVQELQVDTLPAAQGGIAHTRWATHGAPTRENAHPHASCDGRIAVVHNGIFTNDQALRASLRKRGHTFTSETDTEILAHLVEEAYRETGGDLVEATRRALSQVEGSFAVCVVHADRPDEIVAARHESPLLVGVAKGETFVASDVVAFLEHTDKVVYLEDGDLVHIQGGSFQVHAAHPREIKVEEVGWDLEEATLAGYPHFMLKEIHEQPRALREGLVGRITPGTFPLEGALTLEDLAETTDVHLVACGSSYNASQMACALLEATAGLPATAHLASELGTGSPVTGQHPLYLAVTQSGETADTLGAVRALRQRDHPVLALTNVVGSSVTREATAWAPLRAGPELSVAATKSFTSQALCLSLLTAHLAHARGQTRGAEALFEALRRAPHGVQEVLDAPEPAARAGAWIADHDHAYVLGSGPLLAVAHETALKIKEISYVHAEAFATGELKHGPLALIEDGTPVLVHVTRGPRLNQALTAVREVAARGARVLALTDVPGKLAEGGFDHIALPRGTSAGPGTGARTGAGTGAGAASGADPGRLLTATVVGQLIAYHAAVARGCDVDRPRNLAKSVTVE